MVDGICIHTKKGDFREDQSEGNRTLINDTFFKLS